MTPWIDRRSHAFRHSRFWVGCHALRREGVADAVARWRACRGVLRTAPVATDAADGPTPAGVHVLVYGPDHLAGLWAAKSFYHHAGVRWPLTWHQGGWMTAREIRRLRAHFPDSRFVSTAEADAGVEARLAAYPRLLAARRKAVMLRKLIDPVVFGRADSLLLLDTDVLFFRRPTELLAAVSDRRPVNWHNADVGDWYNITAGQAAARYGVALVQRLNAGLSLVRRAALRFDEMDEFSADADVMSRPWLAEQTIHALLGSRHGAEVLPPTYRVSTGPGLTADDGRPLVAKHYASAPRPWLFREGIPAVALALAAKEGS